MDKRDLVRGFQRSLLNPVARHIAGRPGVPRYVLLETVGRRTGRPRHVPVGAAVDGRTLWIVAEHGCASDWVRNIDHEPRVRVRRGGHWLRGRARVLEADDPEDTLRRQGPIGRIAVRLAGTDLLPVRIDLEDDLRAELLDELERVAREHFDGVVVRPYQTVVYLAQRRRR